MLARVSTKPTHVTLDDWIDRDLSRAMAAGELSPAFEIEDLVGQCEGLLCGPSRRTPVLVGPRGVGKTAVIHELIRRAHDGQGWSLLANARVVQLSLRTIAAQFPDKADAGNQFAAICEHIIDSNAPIVPFIRDVHLAYSLDWGPILHRFLDRLPHPALCEASPRELDQMFEYWTDLESLMAPICVQEPTVQRVQKIVDAWASNAATQGRREVTPDARRYAIELTARFMGDQPNPRKVIDLLDQTLAMGTETDAPVVLREVVRRFSQLTRVPERLVDPDTRLDLAEVREFVASRLLGQDEAVDSVVRMIALIKAGLADLRRPLGAFLFVGPTGVGKTHCAQLLAEYLFGDPHRLIRLNMADYGSAEDVGTVFGRPLAQRPKDQRGALAQRLKGHPFGVLLLDAFEKAHGSVHDRFLQVLDEGRFTNGRGETVSLSSLIVLATSNAGAEVYRASGLGFERPRQGQDLVREVDRAVHGTFRFELTNRFDRVVHFRPLRRAEIRAIARRELSDLSAREGLRARGLKLDVDLDVLDWLVAHGYHPHFGARFLRRVIERSVVGTLAEFLVREMPPRGRRVGLCVRRDRVVARLLASKTLAVASEGGGRSTLSRGAMLDEADAWLQRFERLEADSTARATAASSLIEASTGRGFWDDPARAEDVLRRYQILDARLQVEKRLLKPIHQLQMVMGRDEDSVNENLAEVVDAVAVSYQRWLELGAPNAPNGVWLVMGPADSVDSSSEWLVDLVGMYRGWLRRKGFSYDVVAEEVIDGEVSRLVMEVEGAGALRALEMEEGEHRRWRSRKGVDRARIWLVPRGDGRHYGPIPGGKVADARRGRGVAVARRTARLTLQAPSRGVEMVLHGSSNETLSLLGRDLGGLLSLDNGQTEVAREYGIQGGAVRDPRTSATNESLKDVLRGQLEVFLRAWEAR
jgi:ATP-dependent Clp protease ATP-binding subunit ClpA